MDRGFLKYIWNMLTISFLSISLLTSSSASAALVWSPSGRVVQVYPNNTGLIFVLTGPTIGGTCSGTNSTRFFIPMTSSNYDAKVSSILLAFSGGYSAAVVYESDTLGDCDVTVERLRVDPA